VGHVLVPKLVSLDCDQMLAWLNKHPQVLGHVLSFIVLILVASPACRTSPPPAATGVLGGWQLCWRSNSSSNGTACCCSRCVAKHVLHSCSVLNQPRSQQASDGLDNLGNDRHHFELPYASLPCLHALVLLVIYGCTAGCWCPQPASLPSWHHSGRGLWGAAE
jgi:hypothetical protein